MGLKDVKTAPFISVGLKLTEKVKEIIKLNQLKYQKSQQQCPEGEEHFIKGIAETAHNLWNEIVE